MPLRSAPLIGLGALALALTVDGAPFAAIEAAVPSARPHHTFGLNLTTLAREQARMAWTDERGVEGETYSVIVVEFGHHRSNLFRDKERVKAFSPPGMNTVSVQFASPLPQTLLEEDPSAAPFDVRHPDGVDHRVRLVLSVDIAMASQGNMLGGLTPFQVSHLRAACSDPSETTIMKLIDETCMVPSVRSGLPISTPRACYHNVVRVYPYNSAASVTKQQYIPLGARDTFPFIDAARRTIASKRTMLFNLMVTAATSPRRREVIEITHNYTMHHPEVSCQTQASQTASVGAMGWEDLLLDSRFTISPGGHNAETFRMWEALEAGSIPIVSKLDYTDPAYTLRGTSCGKGDVAWNTIAASPFAKEVSVNSWAELPDLLDRLQNSPEEYIERLQADCIRWYSAVMRQTYASVLNFGHGFGMWPQNGPIVNEY